MFQLYYAFITNKLSTFLFYAGVFLLVSAPFFGSLFFLISLLIKIFQRTKFVHINNFSFIFYISAAVLVLSATLSYFLRADIIINDKIITENEEWNFLLNWIGLSNWLPFFFFFPEFKSFLNKRNFRQTVALLLLLGSFPLLIGALGQYFFNWHGPFVFANGLISWYQRPINDEGVTGLFNNANYAGSWFLIIWPITIAFLRNSFFNKKGQIFFFITSFLVFLCIILTKSRNAWFGSLITIPFVFEKTNLNWFIPLVSIIFFIVLTISLPIFPSGFNKFFRYLIPDFLLSKFDYIDLKDILEFPRISIWISTINLISQRPFLGWGAASFPFLYKSIENSDIWYGHTHNIILEITYNYGLLASLSVVLPIIFILVKSFKVIYLSKNLKEIRNNRIFDKAWWTSCFCLSLTQLFDIQYYDLRISIVFWILLAGLVCSFENKHV